MSIRKKTLLTIGITLLTVIVVVFITSRMILLDSYLTLEEEDTRRNLQRALNVHSSNVNGLIADTEYWAYWDDSYTFVEDRNQAYIDINMLDTTFDTYNLNFIAFVNKDNEIIYSKGFDLDAYTEIDLPAGLTDHLTAGSPLLRHGGDNTAFGGVLMLPDAPVLVASAPILPSGAEGEANGTLFWGRVLSAAEIEKIADITQLSLNIHASNDPAVDAAQVSAQSPVQTLALDEHTAVGYALIADIYDHPALLLKVEIPRTIYSQGVSSLNYFLLSLLGIGVVFVIVATIMLDQLVLSRVTRLDSTVTTIRDTGDLSTPVQVDGNDELASLAASMKEMLHELAESQIKLKKAHDELEQRVQERTAELSHTNTLLKQEIAERVQVETKLVMARDQAIESLRLKTQILANISHDARTPLNIIMLRSEMLQRGRYGTIGEEQHKAVDNILVNARQLLVFVNNLLSEAQLSGDQAKLACVDFNPHDLIESVSQTMQPLAERKALNFQTEFDENLPQRANGDPDRLKQILNNLIDNAIKFTDTGGITVKGYKQDDSHWVVSITDTGNGIPPEALTNIFEAFWQVDGSITRTTNRGIGLGLSIVKQLTTLMGGKIEVVSKIGSGSTFTVTLPCEMNLGEPVNGYSVNN